MKCCNSVGGSTEADCKDLEVAAAGEEGAVPAKSPRKPRRRTSPKVAPDTTGYTPISYVPCVYLTYTLRIPYVPYFMSCVPCVQHLTYLTYANVLRT